MKVSPIFTRNFKSREEKLTKINIIISGFFAEVVVQRKASFYIIYGN